MKGQIIKVSKMKSRRTSGDSYFVIFKCEDGKSRKSWIDSGLMNFKRWENFLKTGITLDNLGIKGDVIDADSYPKLVQTLTNQPQPKQITEQEIKEAHEKFEQNKLVDVEQLKEERIWL